MSSMIPASVVDLPEPVGPVTSTRPRGRRREVVQDGREAERLDAGELLRDEAERGADGLALEERVHAEAGGAGDRVGEVELPIGLEALALVVREDRVDDLARRLRREDRVLLELHEAAAHADDRMRARGDVEIGGPAVQDLEQEFGEVEGHPPVIDRCTLEDALQVAFMDDRMILGSPPWPRPHRGRIPPSRTTAPPRGGSRASAGPRAGGGGGDRPRMGRAPFGRRWLYLILALLAFNVLFAQLFTPRTDRVEVPYTFFVDQVDADNVVSVNARGETIKGEFKKAASPRRASTRRRTSRPSAPRSPNRRTACSTSWSPTTSPSAPRTRTRARARSRRSSCTSARRSCSSASSSGSRGGPRPAAAPAACPASGRSRAKRYEPTEQRVTFDDVEGIDEAEEELVEIVDFLSSPDRYRALGAAIPKGVLLSGPPGTGKTLLARAVAGEADVPFFFARASEFVEMVVGVGASRVRDLFEQAKKAAPRSSSSTSSTRSAAHAAARSPAADHDEREQTLNQILTEMDGFTARRASSCSLRRTARRCSTRRSCVPAASIAGSSSTRPTRSAGARSSRSTRATCRSRADVDLGDIAADDAGHGRRRPEEPRQRGGDPRGAAQPRARARAEDFDDAMEKILLGAERNITLSRRGARAHRLSTSPATRCSACSSRAPTRCARSRSSRAAARSA